MNNYYSKVTKEQLINDLKEAGFEFIDENRKV